MTSFSTQQKFAIILGFLLFIAGIWFFFVSHAGTQLALTLASNPDLERGLVAHWTFDGPTVSSTAGSGGGGTGWDVSTASYDSVGINVTSQTNRPDGIAFKSDGTKMYAVDGISHKVLQYSLSSAWDLSTASYDSVSKDVSAQVTNPYDVAFKSDGTKMYVGEYVSQTVHQYSLSSAWDVSTASYDSVSKDLGAQEPSQTGYDFKADGTKLYLIGDNSEVYQYSLSSPWDLSTASYDSVSKDVNAQDSAPEDVAFKSDGTKMYVLGNTNNTIFQYSLSSAWDLSTASYDSVSTSVGSQDTGPLAIAFKSDGSKIFMAGNISNIIYQYSLSSTGDSGSATIADESGQGISLSMDTGFVSARGPLGQAFLLDGSTAVATTSIDVNGVQSIAFWMSPISTTQKILELGSSGKNITLVSGAITTGLASPTVYVDGEVTTTFPDDQEWHHVVVTTGSAVNATDIKLGMASSTYFGGSLDDVRFYSRALSQAEIMRLYQLGGTTRVAETVTSNHSLDDTLEGHWTFDGALVDRSTTTNTYLDSSSNARHADVVYNNGLLRAGVIGQALEFDGAYTGANAGSWPEYDSLDDGQSSISAWIYPTSLGRNNQGYIVSKASGSVPTGEPDGDWAFHLTNDVANGIKFEQDYTVTNKSRTSVANSITLNEWQHVLVTWDGSTVSANTTHIYVNGVEVAYQTTTDGAGTTVDGSLTGLMIGRTQGSANNQTFAGRIDDVRVYSSILSQEDITRLYQLGGTTRIAETLHSNTELERGLVGHFTFDGDGIDLASTTGEIKNRVSSVRGNWNNHGSTTVRGPIGQALSFDGSNDSILLSKSASIKGMTKFSMSMWVYSKSITAGQNLFAESVAGSGQNRAELYLNSSNHLRFAGRAGDADTYVDWVADTRPLSLNTWYHVVVVFDSESDLHHIYLNGVDTSNSVAVNAITNSDPQDGPYLGTDVIAGGSFFHGHMDDFLIYNRVLSQTEVTRLYQQGL